MGSSFQRCPVGSCRPTYMDSSGLFSKRRLSWGWEHLWGTPKLLAPWEDSKSPKQGQLGRTALGPRLGWVASVSKDPWFGGFPSLLFCPSTDEPSLPPPDGLVGLCPLRPRAAHLLLPAVRLHPKTGIDCRTGGGAERRVMGDG